VSITRHYSQTAYDILAYLQVHPQARDTREGILRWWILEQRIREETRKVEQALTELVRDGLLCRIQACDGRNHFGLNAAKLDEIRDLLMRRDSSA
jgi:hypothetical protein